MKNNKRRKRRDSQKPFRQDSGKRRDEQEPVMKDGNRDKRQDGMVVSIAFAIIIAFSVWQQGSGFVVSVGAGALAGGLCALFCRLIFR